MQKAWLSDRDIRFTTKDVVANQEYIEELAELGVYSTPATLVNGELIVGFDRDKLTAALGLDS